jgi:hypothetical protein
MTRLCIHNLPTYIDEKALKMLCVGAVKEGRKMRKEKSKEKEEKGDDEGKKGKKKKNKGKEDDGKKILGKNELSKEEKVLIKQCIVVRDKINPKEKIPVGRRKSKTFGKPKGFGV